MAKGANGNGVASEQQPPEDVQTQLVFGTWSDLDSKVEEIRAAQRKLKRAKSREANAKAAVQCTELWSAWKDAEDLVAEHSATVRTLEAELLDGCMNRPKK